MQNQNKDYNKQMDAENNKQQEELKLQQELKLWNDYQRRKVEEIAKEFVTPKSD